MAVDTVASTVIVYNEVSGGYGVEYSQQMHIQWYTCIHVLLHTFHTAYGTLSIIMVM